MLSEAKGLEVGQEQVRLAEGYVQLPMHQVRTRLWQLPRLPVSSKWTAAARPCAFIQGPSEPLVLVGT
jgi:hypothetical protein